MTSALDLLLSALKAQGADGLANCDIGCGCGVDDLCPGGDGCPDLQECEAARRFKGGTGLCDGDFRLEMHASDPETTPELQNLVDRANMLPAALGRIAELETLIKAQCRKENHDSDRIKTLETALVDERAKRECGVNGDPCKDCVNVARDQLQKEGLL